MDSLILAIIIITAILIILGVYFFVKKMSLREGKNSNAFSGGEQCLDIKKTYMNKEEFYFYSFVREHLDEKYFILPKVGVDNILEPKNNNLKQYNAIKQKYIDFIVFETSSQKPLFAIDLVEHPMSSGGLNPHFDKDVKSALDMVGLPICTKIVEQYYVWNVLKEELDKFLPQEVKAEDNGAKVEKENSGDKK